MTNFYIFITGLFLGIILGLIIMYLLMYKFPVEFTKISNEIKNAKVKGSSSTDLLQTVKGAVSGKKDAENSVSVEQSSSIKLKNKKFLGIFKKKNKANENRSNESETDSKAEESTGN